MTAETFFQQGNSLYRQGQLHAAADLYRRALELDPAHADALANLGCALRDLGNLDEAVLTLCAALELKPRGGEIYSNLGNALKDMGRLTEAEAACRAAVALMPGSTVAKFNLGCVLQDQRKFAEAESFYRSAIAAEPDYVRAHWNLGLALLAQGKFKEGWAEHEWRARTQRSWSPALTFEEPAWTGEDLAGKTLLIHREQGLGDNIQFARYAVLAAAQGARVVVLTYPSLAGLLRTLPGVAEVVADGEPLPAFDLQAPILSLPHLFGTELSTIPAEVPYLRADPDRVAAWRARLAPLPGLKVGLVWAGGTRPNDADWARIDSRRSLALAQFADIAGLQGISLVSLQKGQAAAQAKGFPIADFTDEIEDFADTAALIEALDLVVSVDTAVAHLAGALGKPVWILSRYDACWRWLDQRDDSPWYPTARLYREGQPHSWPDVLARVKDDLSSGRVRPS
ncbi:MAG TPA: tetratricopeptide repeat-containing glycosyltransferase family protein [Magnetospirillaceae bacterium]|nr:tetratricopeptide repeat-containing glycosyltransferase family protein [Magnetospirillaceae bacterium]